MYYQTPMNVFGCKSEYPIKKTTVSHTQAGRYSICFLLCFFLSIYQFLEKRCNECYFCMRLMIFISFFLYFVYKNWHFDVVQSTKPIDRLTQQQKYNYLLHIQMLLIWNCFDWKTKNKTKTISRMSMREWLQTKCLFS